MVRKGKSLAWLCDEPESADELLWDHALDISGSVYVRTKELGLSAADLARRMGMDKGQLSKIMSGKGNITLKTIARLEEALDFRLDKGFRYEPVAPNSVSLEVEVPARDATAWAKYTGDRPANFIGRAPTAAGALASSLSLYEEAA